jgi:primary-amine oxidase
MHWFYNNVLYNSTEAFRAAWATPGFVIMPPNLDGEWTHIDSLGADIYDERPVKEHLASGGPHSSSQSFELDKKQKFVSWKGFEFYMAFSAAMGLTLYDIRFQGERILYELGLQEALSQYAGSDPVQGAAKYLDSFWGMGATMLQLVPGTYVVFPVLRRRGNTCI